jgi:hypothetical protein
VRHGDDLLGVAGLTRAKIALRFVLAGALERLKSSPAMRLHELIDWRAIDAKLVGPDNREATNRIGPIPYAAL